MRATAGLLALLALTAACGPGESHGTLAPGIDPHAPIDLVLIRADGAPLDLAALRGRAVLVVAFRMDELPSNATLRDADRLARTYPDDLAVVGLVGDERPFNQLRTLLDVFSHVLDLHATTLALADDSVRAGQSALGEIAHVPTVWLINRAGRVARRVEGLLQYEALATLVAPALPPGARPRRTVPRTEDPTTDPARAP